MEQQKHLIELIDISKDYAGDVALEHVNLYINDGEFLTLLGPSGCGKTTLLRCIAGFIMPSSGMIKMNGVDIAKVPPHKREINTVFQKYALFPHLNVHDNIAFGLKIKKTPKDKIEEKVNAMLKLVNLEGYGKRWIDQLSGGQQQRVAIARALVLLRVCIQSRAGYARCGAFDRLRGRIVARFVGESFGCHRRA